MAGTRIQFLRDSFWHLFQFLWSIYIGITKGVVFLTWAISHYGCKSKMAASGHTGIVSFDWFALEQCVVPSYLTCLAQGIYFWAQFNDLSTVGTSGEQKYTLMVLLKLQNLLTS